MGNPVVHFDITGTDGAALERFYSEVFGWQVQHLEEMQYGLVDTRGGGGINGGIGTARDGGPTMLAFYVEVPDPRAAVEQAEGAGARVLVPVTEIPDVVTFALLADPAGNPFGIVGAGEGPGPSEGDGAPVVWFELLGPDPQALLRFYGELFGWSVSRSHMEGFEYHEMSTGSEKGISGGIGISPEGSGAVNVYAEVREFDAYLERARAAGGAVAMPPTEVGPGTTIAHVRDPQGLTFGLVRRAS